MTISLQLDTEKKPFVAYAVQSAILIGATIYAFEVLYSLQHFSTLPPEKVLLLVIMAVLIEFYSVSTFRAVTRRSATPDHLASYFWIVLILYPFVTLRSFDINRALNNVYDSQPIGTAAQAALIGYFLFLSVIIWASSSKRLRRYLSNANSPQSTFQDGNTIASQSPHASRSTASRTTEFLIRAAFFVGVASIGVFGLLFAGFASDSGPNPTATGLVFSAVFFEVSGLLIALTPTKLLFSSATPAKAIWGLFLISIILPFVVLAMAL